MVTILGFLAYYAFVVAMLKTAKMYKYSVNKKTEDMRIYKKATNQAIIFNALTIACLIGIIISGYPYNYGETFPADAALAFSIIPSMLMLGLLLAKFKKKAPAENTEIIELNADDYTLEEVLGVGRGGLATYRRIITKDGKIIDADIFPPEEPVRCKIWVNKVKLNPPGFDNTKFFYGYKLMGYELYGYKMPIQRRVFAYLCQIALLLPPFAVLWSASTHSGNPISINAAYIAVTGATYGKWYEKIYRYPFLVFLAVLTICVIYNAL